MVELYCPIVGTIPVFGRLGKIKTMKRLLLPIFLVLVGCGTVDSGPSSVNGEWSGVVYVGDWFNISMDLAIDDSRVVGSTIYHYEDGSMASKATHGDLIGNEEHFRVNLQVGQDYNPAWVYTGYVNGSDELCLVRDVLPEPVRCLTPLRIK